MLQKKNEKLYLFDNSNPEKQIIFSRTPGSEIGYIISTSAEESVAITINESEQDIYNCFNKLFNIILKEYWKEPSFKREMFYRPLRFVDEYTPTINFRSDSVSNKEQSNLFQIHRIDGKNGQDRAYELRFFYNENTSNPTNSLSLLHRYGIYDKYVRHFFDLHSNLEKVATIIPEASMPDEEKSKVKGRTKPLS